MGGVDLQILVGISGFMALLSLFCFLNRKYLCYNNFYEK
jgi:hypothetical protein